MRKILTFVFALFFTLIPVLSRGQTTVTPNIGLQVPAFNQSNWQVPLNYDLNRLDLLLSGNLSLPSITSNGTVTATEFCLQVLTPPSVSCITTWPTGGGGISSLSAGSLSPLFSTTVINPTTAPTLSFNFLSAPGISWFGNALSSSAAPTFNTTPFPGGNATFGLINWVNVTQAPYYASGSAATTTTSGSTPSGSSSVTVADASTFLPNEGIYIASAGTSASVVSGTITYSSGGSSTGSGTCFAYATNGSGANAWGTVAVSSGTISGDLTLISGGQDYASVPTTWTLSRGIPPPLAGATTCSGTITTTGGSRVAANYIGTITGIVGSVVSISPNTATTVGNGTLIQHDETAAFQSATTLFAATGGTVFVPDGFYRINGPWQDTSGANAILNMPVVSGLIFPVPGGTWGQMTNIAIEGLTPPPLTENYIQNAQTAPVTGVILQTDATAGNLIGGYNAGANVYANFTDVKLTLKNLTFRSYDNPAVTLVNAHTIYGLDAENLNFDTGVSTFPSQPTRVNGAGLLAPVSGNSAFVRIKDINTAAQYLGFDYAEHTIIDRAFCSADLWCGQQNYGVYSNVATYIGVDGCAFGLNINAGSPVSANIEHFYFEHATTAAWQLAPVDINDPNNALFGNVYYQGAAAGGGGVISPTIVGGFNARITPLEKVQDNPSPWIAYPTSAVTVHNGVNNDVVTGANNYIGLVGMTGDITVTGFALTATSYTDFTGKVLVVKNDSNYLMTFANDSGSSLAGNRIWTYTGTDVSLRSGIAEFIYDSGTAYWLMISPNESNTPPLQPRGINLAYPSGVNNNVNVTGINHVAIINATGPFTITGFSGVVTSGTLLAVENYSIYPMTLTFDDAGSSVGNRINTNTGKNVVVAGIYGGMALLIYDAHTGGPSPGAWYLIATSPFNSPIGVTLVNGANNDVAVAGATYARISGPTAAFNTTGLSAGYSGQTLTIENSTLYSWTINNLNSGSLAGNRIVTTTGADLVLPAGNGSVGTFVYDTTGAVWVLSGTEPAVATTTGMSPVAVGSLPGCAAGTLGVRRLVNDANSATPGATAVGSGTYTIAVECIYNSSGTVYVWIID